MIASLILLMFCFAALALPFACAWWSIQDLWRSRGH